MRKTDYEKVYEEFYQKIMQSDDKNNFKKDEIISFDELKTFIKDIRKGKPKCNQKYSKEKEIAEMYSISFGFLAIAMYCSHELVENEYKDDNLIFSALLTQIANTILGVIELVNQGFEYQVHILMRSLIEMMFCLLVLIINKDKRKIYFKASSELNSQKIWANNFSMRAMNEDLEEFEKLIDEQCRLDMQNRRKSMYKNYSLYIHNEFLPTFIWMHSISEVKNCDEKMNYNLWGQYNYAAKKLLKDLNEFMEIYCLYFFYLTHSSKNYFDAAKYVAEPFYSEWNNGLIVYDMTKREFQRKLEKEMKHCKDKAYILQEITKKWGS